MRMRVLHVINSLSVGGAETLLVNSLTPGGLQNHVENILVYFGGTSTLIGLIDKEVKLYCLNYKGISSLPRVLHQLRKIIKQNKIDIVHSHLNPAGFYTHLICPSNIPQVHTLHTTYSTDKETSSNKLFLEKQFYFKKKSCNIIFLSEFTKNDFLSAVKFNGTSFVLNNFIDDSFYLHSPKEYKGSAQRGLKLIAVGHLRLLKNYFYILDIFKHLKENNIQLDIYGGGNMEKYTKIINDNRLNVILKGQVMDINTVIAGYDLFIMASTSEGFPLSVFEAMAAGVPLMLSNIKPLTSIVKDNAIYFDLDNAEKVAHQLVSVLQNRSDINVMAARAKIYAEATVRREIYIDKLLKIYDQLLT